MNVSGPTVWNKLPAYRSTRIAKIVVDQNPLAGISWQAHASLLLPHGGVSEMVSELMWRWCSRLQAQASSLDWRRHGAARRDVAAERLQRSQGVSGISHWGKTEWPKVEIGDRVLGGSNPYLPSRGLGKAVSSRSGVWGGAPTAQRFPLFSALRMTSTPNCGLILNGFHF